MLIVHRHDIVGHSKRERLVLRIMFEKREKIIYTIPVVLFIFVMVIFPIIYTVKMSFYDWDMSSTSVPSWIGLENYVSLLSDSRFWNSVWVTAYFSFSALFIETILGIAIALLLNRKMKGSNFVKAIFLLPMVATPVAIALVWLLIFEPSIGIANELLNNLGIDPLKWLSSPSEVIPSLVIIDVWQWTPMVTLIVMAGLTTLPKDPYESADVDGATNWQKFIYITLPLLKQTIAVAVILRLVDVLKAFDIIYTTTQGGPSYASETLSIYGYVISFQFFKLGMASSLIVIIFAFILLITLPLLWIRKRMEVYV